MTDRGLNARLDREFGGKYRLRPSVQTRDQVWILEQKVGRASAEPRPRLDKDGHVVVTDDWIRAREGYWAIMDIREHERFPCRKCGRDLKVPILKTAEVVCACGARSVAAFFPLDGDAVLQKVRALDRQDYKALAKALTTQDQARLQMLDKDHINDLEAISRDIFPQVVGIPQVGYTGRQR